MPHRISNRRAILMMVVSALAFCSVTSTLAQRAQGDVPTAGREVTILVTAYDYNDYTREAMSKLQPDSFIVCENYVRQQIISVKKADEAPLVMAVLIQDDLFSRFNTEIGGVKDHTDVRGIKDFIRRLPQGSHVMTGYLTAGSLSMAQEFTTDRARAADSLGIAQSNSAAAPFNPYAQVIEALRRFDSKPAGRRIVLLISDGRDTSRGLPSGIFPRSIDWYRPVSPKLKLDLSRAIDEAHRRNVAVFSFHANPGPEAITESFEDITGMTGGEHFSVGLDLSASVLDRFVTQLNEMFAFQWLITYRSTSTGSGFRSIQAMTKVDDVFLYHPAGYNPPR